MADEPEGAAAVTATPRPKAGTALPRSLLRRCLRWIERLLAVVGLLFITYHLAFDLSVMTSESMAPTLQGDSYDTGDWIVAEKLTRWWSAPRRGEIFLYTSDDGVRVMKRVVGMPGERISIRKKKVYIDGAELNRSHGLGPTEYYAYGNLLNGQEFACGEGYYMLGDHSTDSNDSRYTGAVAKEEFQGRAWLIVWPLSRAGFVR